MVMLVLLVYLSHVPLLLSSTSNRGSRRLLQAMTRENLIRRDLSQDISRRLRVCAIRYHVSEHFQKRAVAGASPTSETAGRHSCPQPAVARHRALGSQSLRTTSSGRGPCAPYRSCAKSCAAWTGSVPVEIFPSAQGRPERHEKNGIDSRIILRRLYRQATLSSAMSSRAWLA